MPASPATSIEAARDARSWLDPSRAGGLLVATGIVAYALALIATLPARAVLPARTDAAGTVWHGEAALDGGAVARWDWSAARSLAHGALVAGWTVDGPGTVLTGEARWRPFGGTGLAGVRGRAAWPLLAGAVPGLPPGCAIGLRVAFDTITLGRGRQGATGTLQSEAGTCPGPGGPLRAYPRLIATFTGARGVVTPWSNRAATYAVVSVANDTLHLTSTASGAAAMPGPGRAGDIAVEL